MARRNQNKQQNARYPSDHATEQQKKTNCHTCGKHHRGLCRFANGNQAPRNIPSNQQIGPCHVCGQRHRGSCRSDFEKMEARSQSSNRTEPQGKVYCPGCKRLHQGLCWNIIRGRLSTNGCKVILPLRVAAAKVRQFGGSERVDYFIREVGSEDALMCYCDGTASSFCVKHFAEEYAFCVKQFAEQYAQQSQNNNLVITQAEVAGLRQSAWSNHCHDAFDESIATPSEGSSLTGNVNHTVDLFRLGQSREEDVEWEELYC